MEILNSWLRWGRLGGRRFKVASGEYFFLVVGKSDLWIYFVRNCVGVDLLHKGWIGAGGEGGEGVGWWMTWTSRWPVRPTLGNTAWILLI